MTRLLAVSVLLLLLAGCGSWARTKDGPFELSGQSVRLPSGWYRLKDAGFLLLTRDGPPLQTVVVSRHPVDVPFPHTARTVSEGMLPVEAAEAVLDDLAFDETIGHLEVLENAPAVVGGLPGFRIATAYRDRNDLAYRSVTCGVLAGRWLHLLRYAAPRRHYFDRDLGAFEEIVRSFRPK
jgi:hypothetical protein